MSSYFVHHVAALFIYLHNFLIKNCKIFTVSSPWSCLKINLMKGNAAMPAVCFTRTWITEAALLHTPCKLAKEKQVEKCICLWFFFFSICHGNSILLAGSSTQCWYLELTGWFYLRISSSLWIVNFFGTVFIYITTTTKSKFCSPKHCKTKQESASIFRNSDMPFQLVLFPENHPFAQKSSAWRRHTLLHFFTSWHCSHFLTVSNPAAK